MLRGFLQYSAMPRLPLSLGRYDDAILPAESLAFVDYWVRLLYLVAAYAQKGDLAKAAVAKTELLKRQPTVCRLHAIRTLKALGQSALAATN